MWLLKGQPCRCLGLGVLSVACFSVWPLLLPSPHLQSVPPPSISLPSCCCHLGWFVILNVLSTSGKHWSLCVSALDLLNSYFSIDRRLYISWTYSHLLIFHLFLIFRVCPVCFVSLISQSIIVSVIVFNEILMSSIYSLLSITISYFWKILSRILFSQIDRCIHIN